LSVGTAPAVRRRTRMADTRLMTATPGAPPTAAPPPITALLLAGGRGSRMGGVDKGLQAFGGVPLAAHALARLREQTLVPSQIAINANRNLDAYGALGTPVWPDALPDFAGPLAGFLAGLQHCETPLLLTLPCDVPRFSLSLCERLAHALLAQEAEIAMVAAPEDDGPPRTQPVFCLLRRELRDSLARFMAAGGRKIDAWTAQHRQVIVPFDSPNDDPRAFANANTLAELRRLEQHP